MKFKWVLFQRYVITPGTEHDTAIRFDDPWQIEKLGDTVLVTNGAVTHALPWSLVQQAEPE